MSDHRAVAGGSASRRIKVYGWRGFRSESHSESNRHCQTREIVAARSVAEVLRITGLGRYEYSLSGGETENEHEVELATSNPGVVFWRPLNAPRSDEGWVEA